jgi:rhodanese-related sulfurtransferase
MVSQVTAEELGSAMHGPKPPRIFDVREPHEYEQTHVHGAQSLPLGSLAREIGVWCPNKNEPVVLYDDLGIRSHHAARLLRSMGYRNVKEIMGGLHGLSQSRKVGRDLLGNS